MTGRIQNEDVKSLAEVGNVASRLPNDTKLYSTIIGKQLSNAIQAFDIGTGDSPVRMYAAATPDSKLYFKATKKQIFDGTTKAVAPIDDLVTERTDSYFDFQALTSSGIFYRQGATFVSPSSTTGYHRRFCFSLLSSGIINVDYSAEFSHTGILPNAGSVFATMDGTPIGYVDLECVTGQTFKTSGSLTNVIEANVATTNNGVYSQLSEGVTDGITGGGTVLLGNGWNHPLTESLYAITVKLYRSSGATGNISIGVYTTIGHKPDTLISTSDNIDVSTLNVGSFGEVTFIFSTPPALSSGTKYAFVLSNGFSGGTITVSKSSGSFTNARFVSSSNNGASWTSSTIDSLYYIINPNQKGSRIFWFGTGSGSGSGSVKDFRISSVSTPNAIIKGGFIGLDDGTEIGTYDGSGSASTDFGKDLTVSLTTIFGSAPANATTYYLYVDLNSLAAAVTFTDTGRKVKAVQQANFVLSTTTPDNINRARYVFIGFVRSATSGTAWSGTGAAFGTLAVRKHNNGPIAVNPKVYSLSQVVGAVGSVGQVAAGHVLAASSFPSALSAASRVWFGLSSGVTDGSGNAKDLTAEGTPVFTGLDLFGVAGALTLNGTTQDAYSTDAFFNPGNGKPFALLGWAALTDWTPAGTTVLAAQEAAAGDRGFVIELDSSGNIYFEATNTAGSYDTTIIVPNPGFTDGTYHHFCLLFDFANTKLKAFIDGKLVGQATLANQRAVSAPRFRIGARFTTPQSWAAGRFTNWAFVNNYLLTDDDVRKLYSYRFDHNKNVQTYNQDWKVILQTPCAVPNWNPIVCQANSNSLFADFSDLASTDTMNLALLDMGMSPAVVPAVPPFDVTYTSNPTSPVAHGQGEVPKLVLMAKDASNDWHTISPEGWIKADATNIKWTDLSSLFATYTGGIRIQAYVGNSPTGVKEASTSQPGIIATVDQSFAGIKKFTSGLVEVTTIVATDANKTLTDADNRRQTFTGFSVSRDVILPTTGIIAGEVFILENATAFDMVVKSSNGSALTVANGTNLDATVQKGFVVLEALQATPTTPAHWRVLDVYEEWQSAATIVIASGGGSISSASGLVKLNRHNNVVAGVFSVAFTVTGTVNGVQTSGFFAPARFRPATQFNAYACGYQNLGVATGVPSIEVYSGGNFFVGNANYTNLGALAAISAGAVAFTMRPVFNVL